MSVLEREVRSYAGSGKKKKRKAKRERPNGNEGVG